ncbi:MAG: aldo/keto reductase [Deltaproteobacteria bacterium]|nr:aldo/keto reductase [Deltaproteobacteria bacterium]HCH61606.1 aldo/keto reductase [Deltaproteobacteria bacterium]
MPYRSLGHSGLKVSALSFGAWVTFDHQMDVAPARDAMAAAFEAGCNFFDNAEAYAGGKAEIIMGKALAQLGWGRDEYVVSTKIFWGGQGPNQRGLSRKHIIEGVDAARKRFELDHLDLVFCHRPDPSTPIEETVRAMNHVIDRGWAFYWGTSEWSAEQLEEAWRVADRLGLIGPTMEQPQYHMFHRDKVEREFAGLVRERGLGTTTWSPLASGLLTGKYNEGVPEGSRFDLPQYSWLRDAVLEDPSFPGKIAKVKQLTGIAQELGASMAQLALAWTAKHPHVSTVITGASRTSQVVENMKAIAFIDQLTPDVMSRIEAILDNKPAVAS